jgi:hypothetical protein
MVKPQQKISGCWRTSHGAERFLTPQLSLDDAHERPRRAGRPRATGRRAAMAAHPGPDLSAVRSGRPAIISAWANDLATTSASSRRQLPRAPAARGHPPPGADPESSLLDAIANGELDDHLTALADAVHARHHLLDTVRSATVLAQLRIGDDVRINHTIRPQYLRGLHGTIVDLDDERVTVCLHRPVGRFHSGELRCPPLTLDKLASELKSYRQG